MSQHRLSLWDMLPQTSDPVVAPRKRGRAPAKKAETTVQRSKTTNNNKAKTPADKKPKTPAKKVSVENNKELTKRPWALANDKAERSGIPVPYKIPKKNVKVSPGAKNEKADKKSRSPSKAELVEKMSMAKAKIEKTDKTEKKSNTKTSKTEKAEKKTTTKAKKGEKTESLKTTKTEDHVSKTTKKRVRFSNGDASKAKFNQEDNPREDEVKIVMAKVVTIKKEREDIPDIPVENVTWSDDIATQTDENVYGFIGVGGIGKHMALRLLRNNLNVVVWNRTYEKCDDLVIAGARCAYSPGEVIRLSNITFSCISDVASLQEIFYREDGILAEMKKAQNSGKGYVEMSGIDLQTNRELCEGVIHWGCRYMELQIQGTIDEAESGQLLLMPAGDLTLFQDSEVALRAMTDKAFHFHGRLGSAVQLNLLLNGMRAGILCTFAEMLSMAKTARCEDSFARVLQQVDWGYPMLQQKRQIINKACCYQPANAARQGAVKKTEVKGRYTRNGIFIPASSSRVNNEEIIVVEDSDDDRPGPSNSTPQPLQTMDAGNTEFLSQALKSEIQKSTSSTANDLRHLLAWGETTSEYMPMTANSSELLLRAKRLGYASKDDSSVFNSIRY